MGQYGETGVKVTRTFRFLIHFLIDFRYHQDRQHDGLDQTFKKLTLDMRSLQNDIETHVCPDSNNPLLDSMQRYSSSLCDIWDLWNLLPVSPGDLGIMIPGDDPRCPRFRKIANLAENIQEFLADDGQTLPVTTSYPEYAEQQYVPSDASWSSEIVDASTIRHRLRFEDAPIGTQKFVFSRARKISLLGDSSWDYHGAWSYLRHIQDTGELLALAAEHDTPPEDLMLSECPVTAYVSSPDFRSSIFHFSEQRVHLSYIQNCRKQGVSSWTGWRQGRISVLL
ncbi:hypothetical protein DFH07DRAFT_816814 [Mycena maculata]|uniref:Uncharacterized protein n=1 Tax=Mycena maculata TaxID=230809 RepID=A0AAD7JC50_9AGAR|nr:hypothetical protein DFH07DRAFT_816814 [Mycena maculata]